MPFDSLMLLAQQPQGGSIPVGYFVIIGVSAVWMTIGIIVMRNMINFEI